MFMGMGEQPAGTADNVAGAVFGGGVRKGAGFGWWWHTPDDTLDKMDPDLLERDTQIYVYCARDGLTVFDMPRSRAEQDWEQWRPLTRWIARHAVVRNP